MNRKPKVIETVMPQSKGYKGSVRWCKLQIGNSVFKIERRRPFGWDSYAITRREYDAIKNAKVAQRIFTFRHYMGAACWWGGEIKHPIPEFNQAYQEALMNRESYEKGLHYNSSLVDVVSAMFHLIGGEATTGKGE